MELKQQMIEKIKIERFRGINNCEIDDLKQFNIFLGYNNCGKSSVLDALFLFTGASNPTLSLRINNARNYFVINEEALKLNFYGLDIHKTIALSGKYGTTTRNLDISYWEKIAKTVEVATDKESKKDGELKKDFGLRMKMDINRNGRSEVIGSTITFKNEDTKNASIEIKKDYKEELKSWYITPLEPYENIENLYSSIMENKQEGFVVRVLQRIEPSIKDMVLIDNNIMVDIGLEKRMPIQVLGDGIKKLLSVIVNIYKAKDGVILIDELDNGLHYRSMPVMWKAIIHAAKEFNVQVFVSTHNIDSLRALSYTLEEEEYKYAQDEIRVFTLRKDQNATLHAIKSTYSQFNHLINQEIELR